MISVYTDADYLSACKQKQRIFYVFMGITLAYLAFCIGWLIYHMSLPYADSRQTLPRVLVYVVSAVYIALIFPFMAIKYSRVRRYCKMLGYVSEGLKIEEKNYFYSFREKSLQKDNIDVVGCVFETWSKKKQEWLEREAYFDPEKPLPEFESGDLVKYITQSNFIVQYEIVERHALEFEEEEDDEEYEEENVEEGENNE
ncbi:MAG: hypothetical protein IJX96_05420 [Clostridia bacterium]|nr:hypothetical protein [Clostridia bacterium]